MILLKTTSQAINFLKRQSTVDVTLSCRCCGYNTFFIECNITNRLLKGTYEYGYENIEGFNTASPIARLGERVDLHKVNRALGKGIVPNQVITQV